MEKHDSKQLSEHDDDQIDSELQNIVEAALYASTEPLGIRKIMALFPDDAQPSKVDIQNVILRLEEQCAHRGVELRRIGKGWRYQTKEKYATWLRKLAAHKPPRYSRALLETLSIIAYRQPVTRSDIEEVRGVGVSSETIRTLEEREWVQQIGHRDVPGRPALFGTTQAFLEYFNMTSLRELPELMDKRELGEIAKEMNLTLPMDGVQGEDEAAAGQAQKNSEAQIASEREEVSAEIIELRPEEQPADDDSPLAGDASEITGDASELTGDASELTGDASELTGDASELTSDASELTGDASELTGDASELTGDASELTSDASAQTEDLMGQVEPASLDSNEVEEVDSQLADSQDKVPEDE
jgi:segregation and condensation protein B